MCRLLETARYRAFSIRGSPSKARSERNRAKRGGANRRLVHVSKQDKHGQAVGHDTRETLGTKTRVDWVQ